MQISPIRPYHYSYNNSLSVQSKCTKTQNPKNDEMLSVPYSVPYFGKSRLKVAESSLEQIQEHLSSDSKLTNADEKWLKFLRKEFATPKCFSLEEVNKGENIAAIANALKVMICSGKYKPVSVKLDGVDFKVHNKTLAKMLKKSYSSDELRSITDYLNRHHVFDMSDNPNYGLVVNHDSGLVRTCGATENWEMSERAWITDTMRVGDIQKYKKPKTWSKALNTVASYYATQQEQFERYIANPELYYSSNPMEGIPHIFMPRTLQPDSNWFNNKRLESHGLALKEFCLAITDGLVKGAKHGYQAPENIPETVYLAIDNLSKYFKSIKYEQAPSAGNWEEIPLKGGLTSDTATIRSGLIALRDLLYNPRYNGNKQIITVRKIFSELEPLSKNDLDKMIKSGEERVRATYLEEAPGIRPHDASLSFVTTSGIRLADNVLDDVKKHIAILKSLEDNLVRENGIIRYAPFKFILKDGSAGYSPDSYLNLNYFNAVDKDGKINLKWKEILDSFGSKDCSDPKVFAARAKLSTPDREAQWFMVSEMSTGYGIQIEKLIKNAHYENRTLTSEEQNIIKYLKKKQTEYLNRALSRISDEDPKSINQIKANGLDMPPVTVSEAHQYVTDMYGNHKMVQGTNAPLSWAIASLYKAVKEEQKIITMLPQQ